MSRRCPEDSATLEPRPFHGVTLDACPVCAGLFFDEDEMAALQQDGPEALTEVENAAVRSDLAAVEGCAAKRCPGCAALMHCYTYRYSSSIRLDGCDHCGGVWVQDGDLGRIAAFLRAPQEACGGVPAARREAEVRNADSRHARLLRVIAPLAG